MTEKTILKHMTIEQVDQYSKAFHFFIKGQLDRVWPGTATTEQIDEFLGVAETALIGWIAFSAVGEDLVKKLHMIQYLKGLQADSLVKVAGGLLSGAGEEAKNAQVK